MFDELAVYLDANATPEMKELCLDACQTLLSAGIERHGDIIDNELTVSDNIGNDAVYNITENILKPLYHEALGEFGVILVNDTTLSILVDMLKGITQLDNYDNPDLIRDLCNADEDAEAILAALLEVVGRFHEADYLMQMQSVNPDLIDQLVNSVSSPKVEHEQDLLPSLSQVAVSRKRVAAYLHNVGDKGSWLLAKLDDGLRLGTPFHLLYSTAGETVRTEADADAERAAIMFVGLLLASDAVYETMEGLVASFISHTMTDVNMSLAFRNAALRVLRAVNTGS